MNCPEFALDASGLSDRGVIRSKNEDRVSVRLAARNGHVERVLLAVADGVGGGPAGEIASALAIETLEAAFDNVTDEPLVLLANLFSAANARILDSGKQNHQTRGMACTLVAIIVQEGKMWLASIGDSRAYLRRGDSLTRLTQDHSLGVDKEVTPKLRQLAVRRRIEHMLTRCLGGSSDPSPDLSGPMALKSEDLVLLCSDGLYGVVGEDELAAILRGRSGAAEELVRQLVRKANDHGAPDNVSAVVLRVTDCPEHQKSEEG